MKECFFYVGKSTNPVLRLRQHMAEAGPAAAQKRFPHLYRIENGSSPSPKRDWMIWLIQQDREPELVILEILSGPREESSRAKSRTAFWREAELRWTRRLLEEGHPLANGEVRLLQEDDSEEQLLEAIERGRRMFETA